MENFRIPEIRQTVFSGQKVLSTNQLAALFKCKRNNITDNFRNHKDEFIKDVDYFHPTGDEINALKQADKSVQNNLCVFSKYSTNAYLWTQSGVEKLAKYIGTDEAKLIYTSLVFGYFQSEKQLNLFPQNPTPEFSPIQKYDELKFLIAHCKDKNLRDDLIKMAIPLLQ